MLRRYRWLAVTCVAALILAAGTLHAKTQVPAPQPADEPDSTLVVTRALTEGKVEGDLVKLRLDLEVQSHESGEQRMPLFDVDAAVTDWSVKTGMFGPDAYVRRTGKGLELVVEGEGSCRLLLDVVAKVKKERLASTVTLPIVSGLVTKTSITVPAKDLEFKADPELGMETKAAADTTTAILYGGEGKVVLSWSPKAPEKELKPVAFADQTMLVRIGQGVMRIEAAVDYSIVQGALNEFEVRFPSDLSLLNIEGADIRTWDIQDAEADKTKTLKVSLLGDAEKTYKLTLHLEKVLPEIEMEIDMPAIEPLGVVREKGQIAVSAAKGIRVEAGKLQNVSHVDVREMGKLPQDPKEEVRLGFRYLKRPFSLSLKTGEVVAKTSVEVLTLVRASMDSMRLSTQLNYTIRDAGVFQFQVGLGKGLKLVDITGENINNWQLDEKGEVLTVSLRSKAEGAYALHVETEAEKTSPENAPIPVVHALDVDKEVGYVAVLPGTGMKVETAAIKGASQIDVKELPAELQKASPALAYRYIRPDYEVAVNVSLIEPEVQAELHTVLTLDEHELNLDTEIHYSIRRAGIFQLRVAIPTELRRTDIEGKDIDDTTYDDEKGLLTVNLGSKVMGEYVLKVKTEKTLDDIEKGVALPVISAVDVKKERGFLAIVNKASVRLKEDEEKSEGLDDIGVSDLPPEMLGRTDQVALAFKYFTQPWSLTLAVERIEPLVTAEVFNLLTIGEKLLTVSSTVTYTIEHAGVDTFTIKVPEGAKNVDILDDPSIKLKEKDEDGVTWVVTLQSKRTGAYALYVNFQQDVATNVKTIPFGGIEAVGVARETGYLAITSRADVELSVAESDITNLTPIDGREIPGTYVVGLEGVPILLAFRYVSHPYMIDMGALQHDAAEVTVAVVEAARLSTTLTKEGDMLTDMVCVLRNTRQQYLDLKLPRGARIMGPAFVTYQDSRTGRRVEKVTPLRDGDVTKIPVAQSASVDQNKLEIRLRYGDERKEGDGGKREKLGRIGTVRLESPFAGIDVMRLGWTLSLPEGYDIIRDLGNVRMIHGVYVMERQLQDLQPDVEIRADVRQTTTAGGKESMSRQYAFNRMVVDQNDALFQAGGGRGGSGYTGSKPMEVNVFAFQSLIVSKDELAAVEVQFLKTSLGIPLKGLVVLAVVLLCGLVWRFAKWPKLGRIGVLLAAALVVLGVRTLAEGAYRGYLTTIIYTLLIMAAVLLVHTIVLWVQALAARRRERKAGMAKGWQAVAPPGAATPPAEEPEGTEDSSGSEES